MKICAMISDSEQMLIPERSLLKRILFHLYYDYGIRKIISGIRIGAEQEVLSYIISQKQNYSGLTVEGVFTHEEEANHWSEVEREKLYRLISQCDGELVLKPVFDKDKEFQRNIVMMDTADMILLLGKSKELEFWARKITGTVLKISAENKCLMPPLTLYRK